MFPCNANLLSSVLLNPGGEVGIFHFHRWRIRVRVYVNPYPMIYIRVEYFQSSTVSTTGATASRLMGRLLAAENTVDHRTGPPAPIERSSHIS